MAFKLEVLDFLDQGRSIREASTRFNIPSRSTIREWQRRYESGGADALIPRLRGRRPMKKPPKPSYRPAGKMTSKEMEEELM
ncbi:Transposase IS3/IS911 family protein [Alloalcanivorax dieselolei B5]|uniref:Transposase IS3/IS911 family protein n=1 Tax=Alcanivorax dieselolei (strain DSM 16502 / CGMCC 1.3690 / MCCC 1A00001 / B-5) TaxID=930169 RepID=K0CF91_ALCDB|nr:Transposase IS3/IS911 family protein [Alloalcanivorax dieselolei B5]